MSVVLLCTIDDTTEYIKLLQLLYTYYVDLLKKNVDFPEPLITSPPIKTTPLAEN